jgi:hypothetical protein
MPIIFKKKVGKKFVPLPAPATINEAIDRIVASLEPDEVEYLKGNSAFVHFTAGMAMRNEWGLWAETSPIKTDFIQRFKLFGHADDMSGIILEGVRAKLLSKNVDKTLQDTAEGYRKHWKDKCNLNPKTGKTIRGREKS